MEVRKETGGDESVEIGAEEEDDLEITIATLARGTVTQGTDWTTETIVNQLARQNIALEPRFQRRTAWSDIRQSRFIESLLLALPIPQIVLADTKENRGRFLVIDGKQRLLALIHFFAPAGLGVSQPLRLTGLKIRKDLNGATFQSLQSGSHRDDFDALQNQTIRTVIVRNWQDESLLYVIFHRLNSGSVQLSPQELRQALHPGPFLDFANDFSKESQAVAKALGLTDPDFRMRDVELVIRYFAFKERITDYRGNLKAFLDDTCKMLNHDWPSRERELRSSARQLEAAIETTIAVFGEACAFRRWNGDTFEGRFNRAVFDIMVFYFASEAVSVAAPRSGPQLVAAFKDLCLRSEDFAHSIQTTTKSLQATADRLGIWGRRLREELGVQIKIPSLRDKRIELV